MTMRRVTNVGKCARQNTKIEQDRYAPLWVSPCDKPGEVMLLQVGRGIFVDNIPALIDTLQELVDKGTRDVTAA